MDSVLVEGLIVNAVIGVFPWEREVEQQLSVDLVLAWDNRRPGQSDDVADALDYAAVCDCTTEVIQTGRFQLLEAAAESIATAVNQRWGVQRVSVTLRKPGAVPQARAVGVRITREFE